MSSKILLVDDVTIPPLLEAALCRVGFEAPGPPVGPAAVAFRLQEGDIGLVVAPRSLARSDELVTALKHPETPTLLSVGPLEEVELPGPRPCTYVSTRYDIDETLAWQLAMRLRELRLAQRIELVQSAAEAIACTAIGPLAPRVKGLLPLLLGGLEAERIAFYACEGQSGPLFPRLATHPEPSSHPLEVRVGMDDPGRVLAGRVAARLGDDLLLPLLAGEVVMGLLWITPRPPHHPGDEKLPIAAARILGLALETRLIRSGTPAGGVIVDPDKLMFVEKLSSLGQLAAGIAHEINNPLFVISGNLEIAITHVDEATRALLAKALKAADRIRRIVYDMRQFYLPSTHSARVAELSLSDLVASAIQIVSLQPLFKNIGFVRDTEPEVGPVMGDDNQLLQVLTNLFLNAAQAMPRGGLITIRLRARGDQVVLTVSDTGVGIPKENLSKVFDPFFTTKQDWFGTGLGLSVSFTIVKNHGGVIEVESGEGKGATFTIRLPSARAAGTSTTPRLLTPVPGVERVKRILVADAEESVRDFLQFLLASEGYTVDVAVDGASVIAMLGSQSYGAAIVDHVIAGIAKLDTFREIRSRFPRLPVILLTGVVEADLGKLGAVGFTRVLAKPCRGEDVVRAVADALR